MATIVETIGQTGRSVKFNAVRSSNSVSKGMLRKGNPQISTGKRGYVPPPGPEREARLFKMVNGVRVPGYDVAKAEQAYQETLADSNPVSTNGKNMSSVTGNTSSTPIAESPGIKADGILAGLKSGLTTYMPALLVIGAVILGIVVIRSSGRSSGGRGRGK